MNPGGAIRDFWLGEPVAGTTRYHKRHKRDGLCYDCKRNTIDGQSRCARHQSQHAERCRKYAEAMKRKAEAASTVKCAQIQTMA
jgi:hypothetical protein